MTEDKVRENLLRRVLDRRGLMLKKARRKDRGAWDYGRYWILDSQREQQVAGGDSGLSIDEVEAWITEYDKSRGRR